MRGKGIVAVGTAIRGILAHWFAGTWGRERTLRSLPVASLLEGRVAGEP